MKTNEQKLYATICSIGEALVSVNNDGKISFINEAAEIFIGCKQAEVIGKKFNSVVKIIDLQTNKEIINPTVELLNDGTKREKNSQGILKSNEGKKSPIEINIAPIKSDDGNVEGAVLILRDITEKKRAEEDLKKLSSAIEQSHTSIIITDPNGIVEYVNSKYLDTTNESEAKIMGNPYYLFSERELTKERLDELWQTIRNGNTWKGELVNLSYKSKMLWESVSVSPIFNNEHEIINIVIVKEDITERKRAEDAIKKYNEELKELNNSKDKFFSIVSHDLRSPFNGILGLTNLLVSEFDALPYDELKNVAVSLKTSTNHLFKYIENLLEWSRSQSGKMSYQPIKIDLHESIVYILNLLSPGISTKNIAVEYHLEDDSFVYADSNMMNSILENLISNAIKFTNTGGKIKVSTEKQGMFIRISIADNGVGIKEDKVRKLFILNSHHSTEGTNGERGTGLGLLLCKEMVEMNGGKIMVKTRIGEGTTFYFTLPCYDDYKQVRKV